MDWVLMIFGIYFIKKKRPVRPVFPDYLSVSYDYDKIIKILEIKLSSHAVTKTMASIFI